MHKEKNNSSIDPKKVVQRYVETSLRLNGREPLKTEELETMIDNMNFTNFTFYFNNISVKEVVHIVKRLK